MPDQDQRYKGVNVGAGDWVVYDKENGKAWVQSDYVLDLSQ